MGHATSITKTFLEILRSRAMGVVIKDRLLRFLPKFLVLNAVPQSAGEYIGLKSLQG